MIYFLSLGILFLLYSLLYSLKYRHIFLRNEFKNGYIIQNVLISSFIILYFCFGYVLFNKDFISSNQITVTILFSGSIFVLLLVKISSSMIVILSEFNENLEQKVLDKNAELLRSQKELELKIEQLKDTQDRLSQASKLTAMGEMAGQIAHEINTPVGAIVLLTQTLQSQIKKSQGDVKPETIEKGLAKILKVTDSISQIVSSLRRIFTGRNSKIITMTNVNELVRDVAWLFGEKAKRGGIHFIVENDVTEDTEILCRSTEIIQVINNLLNNAYDALADVSERSIEFRVFSQENAVHFLIIDNGGGVPGDLREKIFESQFTTKGPGVGSGIGLSISRKIAVDHGGTLELLASLPTTFSLTLPVHKKLNESSEVET
ncbi:MAG: GHKL domain-containing protein [Bdellovibrionales bacterium]|nr:GHKL domain-containing protein [Bdellovibrionales bacterium]